MDRKKWRVTFAEIAYAQWDSPGKTIYDPVVETETAIEALTAATALFRADAVREDGRGLDIIVYPLSGDGA